MRSLFLTYPRIGLERAGLQIQIENTAKELREIGVEVVPYDPWRNQIDEVDVCHMFSTDGCMLPHIQRARKCGKPVVVSPVFNCFAESAWKISLKVGIASRFRGIWADFKRANMLLQTANRVLPLNDREREVLMRVFGLGGAQCVVVPNGINKAFAEGDPRLFQDKFGVKDFVLEVASIEHRKNQLNLIKSMRESPHRLVLVGPEKKVFADYTKQCRDAAGDNVLFVGPLTYEDPLLASAYAAARLFVLPSYSEVMPLVMYEAASAGCSLVVSDQVPLTDNIQEFVKQVPPDSPEVMGKAIGEAMAAPSDGKLREAVLKMASWRDVGEQIKGIYEQVIHETEKER